MRFCKVKDKKPFEKSWNKKGYERKELENWEKTNGEIGWIVDQGYIVVDIDNSEDADRVTRLDLKCGINKSPRGLHLIFKAPKFDIRGGSKVLCGLGILIDYRVSGQQIVWPTNNNQREVIRVVDDTTMTLPQMLYPVKSSRTFVNMLGIGEGERNDALTKHYGMLLVQDIIDDPREVLEATNACLDSPIDYTELETIMDSIDKRDGLKPVVETAPWWIPGGVDKVTGKTKKKFAAHKMADFLEAKKDYKFLANAWYAYSHGAWGSVSKQFVGRIIDKLLKNAGSMAMLNEVQNLLEVRVETENCFNFNDNICVFENGTLDIFKGFREHKKEDLHTIRVKARYDKEAKCPNWLKFTENIYDIDLLQEMLGYLLVLCRNGKSFFVLTGPTDCGKSLISDFLIKLFNEVSMTSLQSICDPANRWAVGEMFGVPLNINTDLSSGLLKDTGVLKQFTGDGTIRYERKGRDAIVAAVCTKLVFLCNALPHNRDISGAFYNRIQIIKFKGTIEKKDQDNYLDDKLWAERDGIIQWALLGLKRLIRNNWAFTRDEATIQKYQEESNSAISFLYEEYTLAADERVPVTDVYDGYKAWCADNGVHPYAKQKFSQIITTEIKGVSRAKSKSVRFFKGLAKN